MMETQKDLRSFSTIMSTINLNELKYNIVEEFLTMHERWFTTNTNDYFGQQPLCRRYLNYRVLEGEYASDGGIPFLIKLDHYFDDFIAIIKEEDKKSFDISKPPL
jgi:hypothetical protein